MRREQIFISTINSDADALAKRYGIGLEIAEYCTARNMDDDFPAVDCRLRELLKDIPERTLHGPFNELHPCAVDPKARALAAGRFRQAVDLAQRYGAKKLILHGGYIPRVYFPSWYIEQSVLFWESFLQAVPKDLTICLENVLEDSPEYLLEIVKRVKDPRLKLCLDVGHANVYSDIPVIRWIEICGEYLSHFHIHNNDGSADTHSGLTQGTLAMAELLQSVEKTAPESTVTLEIPEITNDIQWLQADGFLEEIV